MSVNEVEAYTWLESLDLSSSETCSTVMHIFQGFQEGNSDDFSDYPLALWHQVFQLVLWPRFTKALNRHQIQLRQVASAHAVEWSLIWTSNLEIQRLNKEARGKDSATDVLSFPLWESVSEDSTEDNAKDSPLPTLPLVSLGDCFVSLPWAKDHWQEKDLDLGRDWNRLPLELGLAGYCLERVLHGCLHLYGQHHDTPEAFEIVRTIQSEALAPLFEQISLEALLKGGS
ncbi:MAG: rRNA maturation RNase YbeY [Cyanobacteria bacterium]|nr:rRNA maturation RNase YbeY [Cyanobacteriota bacterium]